MIGKSTYKNAVNKHKIREELLSGINKRKVIGLAGPDITNYNSFMKKRGFKDITSYEKDKFTFLSQLAQNHSIKMNYGDINTTKINKNTFYDLDYCCSVSSLDFNFLNSIDNFLLTVSVRPVGTEKTRDILKKELFKKGYQYQVKDYHDSSPMISVLKIKNN